MQAQLAKYLYRVDFLSPRIGFEYNSNSNFNSIQGVIYSGFVILLTSIVGAMFSKDFYYRQNPRVVVSQETIAQSNVNLLEFPILFTSTINSTITGDKVFDLVDVDLVYVSLSKDLLSSERKVFSGNTFKTCNLSDYLLEDLQIKALELASINSYICLNHRNLSFRNPYSEPDSAFINIRFRRCANPGTGKCPVNVDSLLQSTTLTLGFLDSYIDSKIYLSPVQYRVAFTTNFLSTGFLKRFFFHMKQDSYESDYGWILEDTATFLYTSFYGSTSDYIINTDALSPFYLHSYWATFDSLVIRQRTSRSYMKVQELIATIGGFARFICIGVKFLTEGHLRYIYLLFLNEVAITDEKYCKKMNGKIY